MPKLPISSSLWKTLADHQIDKVVFGGYKQKEWNIAVFCGLVLILLLHFIINQYK